MSACSGTINHFICFSSLEKYSFVLDSARDSQKLLPTAIFQQPISKFGMLGLELRVGRWEVPTIFLDPTNNAGIFWGASLPFLGGFGPAYPCPPATRSAAALTTLGHRYSVTFGLEKQTPKNSKLQVQHPLVDVDGWKMVGSKFQQGLWPSLVDLVTCLIVKFMFYINGNQ